MAQINESYGECTEKLSAASHDIGLHVRGDSRINRLIAMIFTCANLIFSFHAKAGSGEIQVQSMQKKCEQDKDAGACDQLTKMYFAQDDLVSGQKYLKSTCLAKPEICAAVPVTDWLKKYEKKCARGQERACQFAKELKEKENQPLGYGEAKEALQLKLNDPQMAYKTCREAIRRFDVDVVTICFAKSRRSKMSAEVIRRWQLSMLKCGGFRSAIISELDQNPSARMKPDPSLRYLIVDSGGSCQSAIAMALEDGQWRLNE